MRLWSYQAVAHGADTVMFFQMRRTVGACEKYHGAVIDHVGNEHTRVFREVAELGEELKGLDGRILGSRTKSDIAILMDWDNWWAIEYSAGPSCNLKYRRELERFYEPLRQMNYNVDMISPEDDFSGYKLIIAPVFYMVKEGADEKVRNYVKAGGRFLTTYFSGYVQENDLVVLGGYPGKLRDILGIWVEEEDALPEGAQNSFTYQEKEYPAELLCDLLHLEGAEELDDTGYQKDFYQGMPVLTRHALGKGFGYYLATASNEAFYRTFLTDLCKEAGIKPELVTPDEVEVSSRENEKEKFYFVLNHGTESRTVALPFEAEELIEQKHVSPGEMILEPKAVKIFAIKK